MVKRKIVFLSVSLAAFAFMGCGKDPYETSVYSEQPKILTYQAYLAVNGDLPKEGTDPILATGADKQVIKKGKLQFKDSNGSGKLDPYEDWRLPPTERAADLVSKMTHEQKLGILSWGNQRWLGGTTKDPSGDPLYGVNGLNDDGTVKKGSAAETIIDHGLRFSNLSDTLDPVVEATLLNNIQGLTERSTLGIPFFWTSEPGHDFYNAALYEDSMPVAKLSPWPFYLGFGAADDLAVTKMFGKYLGQEIRMRGRHALFGPFADLATEPRWARVQSTIHAQGEIVATHIEVLVKAMQGYDLDKNDIAVNGAIAYLKHFPGMGPDEDGMDSHSEPGRYNAYPGNNFAEHLLPWEGAIKKAKVGGLMMGYSIVPANGMKEVGAAYSSDLYSLLKKLGYNGDIVTDNNPGPWGLENGKDLTRGQKAAMTLKEGSNHWLGGDYLADWKEADAAGLLAEADIDRAATQSLTLMFDLGLFENPYVDLTEARAFWDPKGKQMEDRVAAGKQAMAKAIVLVKDNKLSDGDDLLPIVERKTSVLDTNGNGVIDIYFDSVFDGYDSGDAKSYATSEHFPNRKFVSNVADADVAVIRIFARAGIYFGLSGGVPLSFDAPTYAYDRATGKDTNEKIAENSLTGGGTFMTAPYRSVGGADFHMKRLNAILAAKKANPKLKVIVDMTAERPGIVKPFLDKIDGLFIDFGATDDVFLNMLCYHGGLAPTATLPIEIPSSDASVEAQFEDVPGDSADPTFPIGFGLNYIKTGY